MSKGGAVGIVGGTFDPIHAGHLSMAREAQRQLGLERVLLIPAGTPWQRTPEASAADRLAMARLAVGTAGAMTVDDREVRRKRPTYTLETLQELRAELGSDPTLWLILGADAFLNLPTWHRWEELFQYAHIAVACRPGYDLQSKEMAPALRERLSGRLGTDPKMGSVPNRPIPPIALLDIPLLDISSTGVRNALRHRQPVGDLLPASVLDYIESHQLYR
jgi:nicotinate-nucleotide adenylyltransferase